MKRRRAGDVRGGGAAAPAAARPQRYPAAPGVVRDVLLAEMRTLLRSGAGGTRQALVAAGSLAVGVNACVRLLARMPEQPAVRDDEAAVATTSATVVVVCVARDVMLAEPRLAEHLLDLCRQMRVPVLFLPKAVRKMGRVFDGKRTAAFVLQSYNGDEGELQAAVDRVLDQLLLAAKTRPGQWNAHPAVQAEAVS